MAQPDEQLTGSGHDLGVLGLAPLGAPPSVQSRLVPLHTPGLCSHSHFLSHKINKILGRLGGSAVECLPSAQVMIPEFRDFVCPWAPYGEPASPSACVSASLSVPLMNK